MKEEILDIAKKLYHNHLTIETGTDLLLSLFNVSNSLDLVGLEKKIDKALDSETNESLKKWLHSKRL